MKRSVYIAKLPGSLKNLKLKEDDLPDPASAEVTVEIKTIGLNFADIFSILGLYKAAPKFNLIPGLEFSGIIIKTGGSVTEFKTGDKIYGVSKFGAYTTHLNINENYIIPLPDDWSFDQGAAFPVQALTAYYALKELGNLSADKTVLIHSAAGGVGLYANRIAKHFSAFTIGTVGDKSKLRLLSEENYDHVIVRDRDLKDKIIRGLGKRDLNIVLDTIGGDVFKLCYDLLAPMGRIVVYGAGNYATGRDATNPFLLAYKYLRRPKLDPLKMIEQNKAVLAFNLIWIYDKVDYLRSLLADIVNLDLPKPIINHEFEFPQMHDALRTFKAGKTTGKVVVKVSN